MPQDLTTLVSSGSINTGTSSSASWNQLTQIERRIVIAVVYEGSPEEARKQMRMSHSTFYRHWSRLKDYYNTLIQEFPKRAVEILISQSMRAAQELGKELDSDNERIRNTAANQILDRTLSREPAETSLKRKITLEEWIDLPSTNTHPL